MSIERFADDVAELIDRVADGGPVDVWGFSRLAVLPATRHTEVMQRTEELRTLVPPFLA